MVFYSLYEHNSNSLSWKETNCDIQIIEGDYDKFYDNLEKKLSEYDNKNDDKYRYIKIGSFTAASNITGLLLDVDYISYIIHKHKGFAFFDYASGAPYLKIDVQNPLPDDYREMLQFKKLNEEEKNNCFKDGIFFSPHKFIGGPNTPGVLITHDRIYRNQLKPTQPGGGTVNFVYENIVDYIQDVELKEESGTPNIIGGIRIGLMMKVIMPIKPHRAILKKEKRYIELFMNKLEKIPNLYILHGDILKIKPHIPVFSFMISFGDKFLHPNYVCALLNDLFGIQSRPGCSCAPNYGRFLLGFDKDKNLNILQELVDEGNDIFKPGYIRLNLPYFYPEYVIEYIIEAIKIICENGELLLGLYDYDIKSGKFKYYKSPKNNYKLDLFDFYSNIPKKENFYGNQNKKIMNENELNKIMAETKIYIESHTFLKKTFYLDEKKNPTPRRAYQEFREKENARWFCVFKDVENLLKKMNIIEYSLKRHVSREIDNEIDAIMNQFESKTKDKKKDWSIKYQKIIY